MFELYADKNQLTVRRREPVTSGSVNVYRARFLFSSDWEGLERTAVFRAGGKLLSASLDEAGECVIPWEALTDSGKQLEAGVYGTDGLRTVLPTIWAKLGYIQPGASPGEASSPPSPPECEDWEAALAGKGDALGYTEDGDLGLYAGETLLSSVPVAGGGEGGVSDHRLLSHRDAEKQHPIGAVEGLQAALDAIPAPVEALTNQELEEILK